MAKTKKKRFITPVLLRRDPKMLEPDVVVGAITLPRSASEFDAFKAEGGVEAVARALRGAPLAERLDDIKALFTAVWAEAGMPPMDAGVVHRKVGRTYVPCNERRPPRDAVTMHNLVAAQPYEPAWYAAGILDQVRTLETFLNNRTAPADVAAVAIDLGMRLKEYDLRSRWGTDATSGRKSRTSGDLGRKKSLEATAPERDQRNGRILFAAGKLKQEDPTLARPEKLNRLVTKMLERFPTNLPSRSTCLRALQPKKKVHRPLVKQ